jgi:hypothetical protein
MRIRPATVAAAFALSTIAVTGSAVPALGQSSVCDPYSENCTTPPTTPPPLAVVRDKDCAGNLGPLREYDPATGDPSGGDGVVEPSAEECATSTNTALPFTGGELVLLTGVGAGALAGGVALVAVGRKRKPPAV